MPKVSEHKEAEIRKAIRLEMAKDPLISSRALGRALDERKMHVQDHYLLKLVKKVNNEVMFEQDHSDQIAPRIQATRERFGVIFERLFKIAFWKPEYLNEYIGQPKVIEQIMAMEQVMKMDVALFQAELGAGVYAKKPGDEDAYRRKELTEEQVQRMVKTIKTWGLVTDAPKNDEHIIAVQS